MKRHGSQQLDFFQEPVFPCREPVAQIDLERFRSRIKRAMARALKECRHERSEIAERMAHYLGIGCLVRQVWMLMLQKVSKLIFPCHVLKPLYGRQKPIGFGMRL